MSPFWAMWLSTSCLVNDKNLESLLLLRMVIELDMSTAFWISSLINNTVLHFSSTTLIGKVISLSENPFISSTTAKMLLMSFIPQTLLLLDPISILVWFFAVNAMTSAQILPKPHPDSVSTETLTEFLWNLNKVSVASTRNCPNKILLRSILSSFNLTSSNFILSSPTSSSHLFNSQILNCASSH